MLTPALRVENRIHRPMDRTCVSTGRSPETSGPSSPECTDPNVGTVAEATPATNGVVLRARLLRPAGRHAMVVAHFLNPASDAVYVGRVESAPLMAGAVALASTGYIAAIDKRPGRATSLGPGVQGSPQREPALPTETAREQSTRGARSSHPFGAGLDRSPVAAAGTGCSPANGTLRSLDDWLVLRVINSFTAPVLL